MAFGSMARVSATLPEAGLTFPLISVPISVPSQVLFCSSYSQMSLSLFVNRKAIIITSSTLYIVEVQLTFATFESAEFED